MAYDAREYWSPKSISKDTQGWGATRYYSVTGTASELLDERGVVNAPGIPRVGDSHPQFRELRVVGVDAGGGLSERTVTVRYQWMPNGWSPNQSSDNPLLRPPRISWGLARYPETRSFDIYGNPIVNSAYDAPQNLPSVDRIGVSLRITRWERFFNLDLVSSYVDKVNSGPMKAGKYTFPAGSVLCASIIPIEEYDTTATAVRVGYDFELRATKKSTAGNQGFEKYLIDNPYFHWFIDTGLRGTYDGGGTKVGDFYAKTTPPELITQEIRLNGWGKPQEPDNYYVTTGNKTPAQHPSGRPSGAKFVVDSQKKAVFVGYQVKGTANLLELGL